MMRVLYFLHLEGGAVMTVRKPIIPDENGWVKETVGTWEILCYGKGDESVRFDDKSQKDGQTGSVGLEGVEFEVRESERGRGWDGDSASNRTVPLDVILRAAEIFAWAQDYTPVTVVRNGVSVTHVNSADGRAVRYDCSCQGRDGARWYSHGAKYNTCPNVTERRPVAPEES